MENLSHVGIALALIGSGSESRRTPEGIEEIGLDLGFGQLESPGPERIAFELLRNFRDLRHGVQDHLGRQPAASMVGKVFFVVPIRGNARGGELIGGRIQYGSDQALDVVAVVHEIPGQSRQESFVRRRVGGPEIVLRVHDAPSEEMGPDSIDQASGEVLAPHQPPRQVAPPIGRVVQRQGLAVQGLRRHGPSQSGMADLSHRPRHQGDLACRLSVLETNAGDQVGHPVVLILGPLLQGVIVAAGAGQRDPQEGLAQVFRDLLRLLVDQPVVDRPVLQIASGGGDQFFDEPVPGTVLGNPVPDPVVVGPHGGPFQLAAGDQQQVGPLVGPVVHVFGPVQDRIDEPCPPVAARIPEKSAQILPVRQHSERVQVDPSNEGVVVAQRGGRNPQLAELGQHQVVHPIVAGRLPEELRAQLAFVRHRHPGEGHLAGVPDGDRPLAMALRGGQTAVPDLHDPFVGGTELGLARHVPDAPVREPGPHRDPDHVTRLLQDDLLGMHLDGLDRRVAGLRGRRSRRDPVRDHPVFG